MLVRPRSDTLTLEAKAGTLEADFDLTGIPGGRFIVDIYSFVQIHPDRHLGWWQYELGGRKGKLTIKLDFSNVSQDSVHVRLDGSEVALEGYWANPEYVFEPIQDLLLVIRDHGLRIVEIAHVKLREPDPAVLERYAQCVYETSAYVPPNAPQTFTLTFHRTRLKHIAEMLSRHVPPRSRVLDVASGHSLFTESSFLEEMKREWFYDLVCFDLAVEVMAEQARNHPQYHWLTADALKLPFRDEDFDAVFAGEVIEHVNGTDVALAEWKRVLRPGGTLIMTTPNRKRLTNVLQGFDFPMGPDHINELSYKECKESLQRAGLSIIDSRALYIEAFTNWFWAGPRKFDYLQTKCNWPRLQGLMALLMEMGNLFPWYAWNLIFVCKKTS